MGFYRDVFLLVVTLFKCSLQEGCSYESDGCESLLECVRFADFTPSSLHLQTTCVDTWIRLGNDRYCQATNLRYTEYYEYSIPAFKSQYNEYLLDCFKSLDLSNDNHIEVPNFKLMRELKMVNLSFNAITKAKLSSAANLPKLDEIDYSHNRINELRIVETEYVFKNLKKLNFSNNNLDVIKDATFDLFPNMQYLDVSNNRISHVNSFSFEGMKKLVYLNLAYNNIDDINGSLFRFTQLKRLFLNNNKIGQISFEDFEKLSELEEMDLSFNAITNIDSNVFNAMPFLRIIKINNNELTYLNAQMFLNTSNLQSVDLAYNKIRALPQLIFDGKNISNFDIQYNSIEGPLQNGVFKGLMSVSKLDMSYQNITSIEDFAFSGTDRLINLFLNNNVIRFLSPTSFSNLHNLKHLDLSNNMIADIDGRFSELKVLELLRLNNNLIQMIKKKDFVELKALTALHLSYNNISNIEAGSFENLNYLLSFDLTGCPLSNALETNTFKGMNLLPVLDISCTPLSAIQDTSFNRMYSLESLNISHSAIENISYNAFLNTSKLYTLDLSHNLIKSIHLNSSTLLNLRALYLNHNLISVIPSSNFFNELPSINSINLSFNNISHLSHDAFTKCRELMLLDLSFNKEMSLNDMYLVNLPKISELLISGIADCVLFSDITMTSPLVDVQMSYCNISNVTSVGVHNVQNLNTIAMNNNKIKTLEIGAFSNLSHLISLDLSFNQIKYIQPGVFKDNSNLNRLNVSHNLITTLGYGVFRGLIYLDTLDVSYNEIQDLESERFYDVQNLRTLIIDYNKITKIDFDDPTVYFSMLSIGGNPIPCELLLKLKRNKRPTITAIKLDESTQENIDGVSCYGRPAMKHTSSHNGSVVNDSILTDIRDILLHLSARRASEEVPKTKPEINFSEQMKIFIDEQNSKIASSEKIANVTNSLLERILKIIVAYNSRVTTTPPITKENATFENILPYLQKVKQDMENSLAIEKETIMSDMSNKMAVINKKLEEASVGHPSTSADSEKYKSNPLLFLDVCVGLMLLIVLCLVTYKMYMWKVLVKAKSV